jgi:hypothetical protein
MGDLFTGFRQRGLRRLRQLTVLQSGRQQFRICISTAIRWGGWAQRLRETGSIEPGRVVIS